MALGDSPGLHSWLDWVNSVLACWEVEQSSVIDSWDLCLLGLGRSLGWGSSELLLGQLPVTVSPREAPTWQA